MRIDLGNGYCITKDPMNFILNEVKITKEGKSAGTEYLKPVGFYPTLDYLVNAMLSKWVLNVPTEIQTLRDIRTQLLIVESTIIKAIRKMESA